MEKGVDQSSNDIILWPNYVPSKIQNYNETPNIKIYEHVIWFSKVKAIINKIFDQNNQKIYEDVFELSKFIEMQSSVHLLTKKLMEMSCEGNFEINSYVKDSVLSTLNAHFLMKLKNDNFLDRIKDLDKIFNDLSLRKEIKEESEIQWIHQKANCCHPNLSIEIPRFEPQDLFYLFVSYSGDAENLKKGPIISNINCYALLGNIEKILFSSPETFDECANKIAKIIFRIVFNEERCQFNNSELKTHFEQELQNSLTEISNHDESERQQKTRNEVLMRSAIFVLYISEILSSLAHDNDLIQINS